MGHVLLLRSPSEALGQDAYHRAFAAASSHLTPHSLPILSHHLLNLDQLSRIITEPDGSAAAGADDAATEGSAPRWAGVVITSQRAVEAWGQAAARASADAAHSIPVSANGERDSSEAMRDRAITTATAPRASTAWAQIPFFVPGPSTAAALTSLPLANGLRPARVYGPEETGTGEKLAWFVVDWFGLEGEEEERKEVGEAEGEGEEGQTERHLLYLTGDKNGSTVRDILTSSSSAHSSPSLRAAPEAQAEDAASVPPPHTQRRDDPVSVASKRRRRPPPPRLIVHELQVYETALDASFEPLLLDLVRRITMERRKGNENGDGSDDTDDRPLFDWIVFFSPSGAQLSLPLLHRLGLVSEPKSSASGETPSKATSAEGRNAAGARKRAARLAALGPTTSRYLLVQRGLAVDAVANKPGPKELVAATEEADRRVGAGREGGRVEERWV